MMINNAILNDVFLNDLFKQTNREIYARITALTQKEEAIEYIEGKVSAGSINVDGKSAIRRSCSLTLVAKDININDFYWGIKNKFKLEIGLSNEVNPDYDKIVWFPQGIFLITNFDTNYTTKNCQISIKGKDKMCLLNGEFGGHLPHNTDFGKEKYHDLETDTVTETDIPIKNIIQEIVRNFGDEMPHNIIINNIEDAGLILLEYRGNSPMYMFRKINSDIFTNITFNEKQECYFLNSDGTLQLTTIGNSDNIIYDNLVDLEGEIKPTKIILTLKNVGKISQEQFQNGVFYKLLKQYYVDENYQYYGQDNKYYISNDNIYAYAYNYDENEYYYQAQDEYYIARFEKGSTPGYKLTDLTYAGDLISKAGETVTSVLDKIKKMLGDFEYFYNLEGKFVFQKQEKYNFSNWPSNELDEVIYNDSTLNMEKPIFNLLDNQLITSFKNSPKIADLRNDYSVWGTRKTDAGTERTLHARYAIDIKPTYYKTFNGDIYTTNDNLFNEMAEKRKQQLIDELTKELKDFKMGYYTPAELQAPQKLEDGSYTAGWWDIRDWYRYYQIIKKEIPNRTMKWYSKNNEWGCVPLNTIPGYEYRTGHVWLVIKRPNGTYNVQHGSGTYSESTTKQLCHYSVLDPSNAKGYVTYPTDPPEYKDFHAPYKGCTVTHTYLEFLKTDIEKNGNLVYFYNPNFPNTESTQDAIDQQVKAEIEQFKKDNPVYVVDWREIIYQMALDYRKHYHEDDFLYYLAQNNIDYYPSGVTGYERYYVDLEGFWRTLYNPNPDPHSKSISYLEAQKHLIDDTLYIGNSYRSLKEEEKDEFVIDIEKLYILDYDAELTDYLDIPKFPNFPVPPEEIPPKTPELVPFLRSKYCCLKYNEDKTKSDDIYFYADFDGKVGEGTDDIGILNSLDLTAIYIKARGPFITLEGYEDTYEQMQEEFKLLNLEDLRAVEIDQIIDFDINNYLNDKESIDIYNNSYYIQESNLLEWFIGDINNYEQKIKYADSIKKELKLNTLSNFEWADDNLEQQFLNYNYVKDNLKQTGTVTYDKIIKIYSHKMAVETVEQDYRARRMEIREKYYDISNDAELRAYYYVKGFIEPGDEWPTPSESFNNNLFKIVKKASNNDSKYQFWVFKYPIGTYLNQYPDDYINYAQQQLENYLNEYGWDKLLIQTDESIKFSTLDQDIQRLYYKEIGSMVEYFNLLQYNNFNELRTNQTELINNVYYIQPGSYISEDEYVLQVENFCKEYCEGLDNKARNILKEIHKVNRNNFKTNKEYQQHINLLYHNFIKYLEDLHPIQLKQPAYDIYRIQYQIVYYDFNTDNINGNYWTKLITEAPEKLEFWFDFINGENSNLSKYSIQAIGPRTKVVNDKDVKAIYYKEVPDTIFITSQKEYEKYSHQTGYTYIQLPKEMENIFVTSSRGKSAHKAIEDLLYKHCYGTETATIQTVPIYHLQPNTCLYIRNNETNIDGDYLISKITIPLDQKKMMSITTQKVMPRII